jgi:hypothetical protein
MSLVRDALADAAQCADAVDAALPDDDQSTVRDRSTRAATGCAKSQVSKGRSSAGHASSAEQAASCTSSVPVSPEHDAEKAAALSAAERDHCRLQLVGHPRKIVVGFDGSTYARAALRTAEEVARAFSGTVEAVAATGDKRVERGADWSERVGKPVHVLRRERYARRVLRSLPGRR